MTLRFCADVSPADWITNSQDDWNDLALFGPSGFAGYARLRFMPDPAYAGQSINDAPTANHRAHHDSDTTQIARLCAALETATSTPADCYFAIWEGYHRVVSPLPGGARMRIPNRGYHLYQGPLSEAQRWTTHDDRRTAPELVNHPAFVWPADHAWCVACDTDPHWAGIGASEHTIGTLVARDDIDVVRAHRSGPFYT